MKRVLPFIILFIIAIFYTKPFFKSGFFATHDGQWAVVRLAEMSRELRDFQIPPRWSGFLNHGFGYPLFSYTYPLPYLLGSLFKFVGFGSVATIKILFVLSVIFSSFFMFLLGRELVNSLGGFFGALFYTVAPFRLVDLYVRGSLGESLSLAIFPLLFYVTLKYVQKPTSVSGVIVSIVLAFLILTHNIMAVVFFPFWVIFFYVICVTYFQDVKEFTWKYFLPVLLLGFGLSAFFFLPAILEKNLVMLSQIKLAEIKEHFINLPDFLLSPWSFEKPSFQLGWAHILASLVSFVAIAFFGKVQKKKYFPIVTFAFCSILVLVFLANPISKDFWNIPPLSWIDFPWRLLTPLAFFLAFLSMFLTLKKPTKILGVILVIITVTLSLKFVAPREFVDKPDSYYETNDATTTSKDELMPVWVKEKPKNRWQDKVEVEQGTAVVTDLKHNSNTIDFRVVSEGESVVKVNTIYFPNWIFTINSEQAVPDYADPKGVMRLRIQSGDKKVSGKLFDTPLRKWSNYITLASLVSLSVIFLLSIIFRLRALKKV